jgi:hypothetical protein
MRWRASLSKPTLIRVIRSNKSPAAGPYRSLSERRSPGDPTLRAFVFSLLPPPLSRSLSLPFPPSFSSLSRLANRGWAVGRLGGWRPRDAGEGWLRRRKEGGEAEVGRSTNETGKSLDC